jgi:hypothetical protein
MVGDAFDALDGKALRAYAKQQGIETGGLREPNLRIMLRGRAQATQAAPPPPPPPPPTPAGQPFAHPGALSPQAMLPWPGQQPPPPSIPQAVQAHLAAPPLAYAPPPPGTSTGPIAGELRAALDELNRLRTGIDAVQDRLHRLLGL